MQVLFRASCPMPKFSSDAAEKEKQLTPEVTDKLKQMAREFGKPYETLLSEYIQARTKEEADLQLKLKTMDDRLLMTMEFKLADRKQNPIRLNKL